MGANRGLPSALVSDCRGEAEANPITCSSPAATVPGGLAAASCMGEIPVCANAERPARPHLLYPRTIPLASPDRPMKIAGKSVGAVHACAKTRPKGSKNRCPMGHGLEACPMGQHPQP